jgi:hypothetical protein
MREVSIAAGHLPVALHAARAAASDQ